ncbi:MAG TPA: PAS domain S-box protein [Dongiaceae bacterium]|nr:PAS domain S-box protein [Dongiaceae bacterium]
MIETTVDLTNQAQLRLDAEARLQQGSAPPTQGWALSSNALAVLYKLASAPDSAAEGLRLLHELQTHQVELDLQYEQLVSNERGSAQELTRYKMLYDFAPVGYLVVGHAGHIIESNRAGARLLGIEPEELVGSLLDSFVLPESKLVLKKMLKKLNETNTETSCVVSSRTATSSAEDKVRQLRIAASVSPGNEAFLMVVSEND